MQGTACTWNKVMYMKCHESRVFCIHPVCSPLYIVIVSLYKMEVSSFLHISLSQTLWDRKWGLQQITSMVTPCLCAGIKLPQATLAKKHSNRGWPMMCEHVTAHTFAICSTDLILATYSEVYKRSRHWAPDTQLKIFQNTSTHWDSHLLISTGSLSPKWFPRP